jgi:protein Tex
LEILKQVPGLNKLADKVIQARPIKERSDLLKKVPRLGAKTFENCAAFCRVNDGPEPLDGTLVHPESYDLARWLLKTFGWKLDEKPKNLPPTSEWKEKWGEQIEKASKKFGVSGDRVTAVLANLVDSMMKIDPRLKDAGDDVNITTVGSATECSTLPPELSDMSKLASAVPFRGVIGTIRNIADFGAFIDFGAENDGLLHTSKLGPLKLSNLLIGQEMGVDILSVEDGKISLGVAGLNQEPMMRPSTRVPKPRASASRAPKPKASVSENRSGSKRSMSTESSGKGSKRQKTV